MVFEPFELHCTAPLHKFVFVVLDDGVVNDKELVSFGLKALVLLEW